MVDMLTKTVGARYTNYKDYKVIMFTRKEVHGGVRKSVERSA